jgi:hypothetical protein
MRLSGCPVGWHLAGVLPDDRSAVAIASLDRAEIDPDHLKFFPGPFADSGAERGTGS